MTGGEPFAGHPGRVRSVAFTEGTNELLSCGDDGTARLWDLRQLASTGSGAARLSRFAHAGGARTGVAVGDGSRFATAGADGTVRLWDRASGNETRVLVERVDVMAGTPGCDYVAVASSGSVRVVSIDTGEQLGAFATPNGVRTLALSRTGRTVAWSGSDGTVVTWNVGTGASKRVTAHADGVTALALCAADTWLVTGDADRAVRVWSLESGAEVLAFDAHLAPVRAVAVSDDRAWIVSASDDGVVRVADPSTGAVSTIGIHPGGVHSLAAGPDASLVATGGNQTVRLWVREGDAAYPPLLGHAGGVRALAITPDGTRVVSGGDDRQVRMWDLVSGAPAGRAFTGRVGAVRGIGARADGATTVLVGDDGVVWSWDPTTGREGRVPTGRHEVVVAAAVGPHARHVVTAGDSGTVRVWDGRSGSAVSQLDGHHGRVLAVHVTADGRTIATAGVDGTVRVFDLASGNERRVLSGAPAAIRSMTLTPDGSTVLIGDFDGAIRRWSLDRSAEATPLVSRDARAGPAGDGAAVMALAVTPDGDHVVGAYGDGTIRVWRRATPTDPLVLTGHTARVRALAVTPDGRRIVSGDDDGAIRVWDRILGEQVAGTDFTASPAPPRPGVTSDDESPVDLLGFHDDVGTLAALIADRGTEPPLAIALLGRWGSGKSSFLRQLRDRVEQLADLSRNNPSRSVYTASVRQVRFNAWHYGQDHLWVGLVEQLFASLVDPGPSGAAPPNPARVRADRDELRRRLADLSERRDRLSDEVAASDRRGLLGTPTLLAALLRSGIVRPGRLLPWATVLVLAVVTGVAAWRVRQPDTALGLVTLIGALVAAALPFVVGAMSAWRRIRDVTRALREKVEARQEDLDRELRDTRASLHRIDAAARLAEHLVEARDGRYEQFHGVFHRVHQDLSLLSKHMADAQQQWRQARSPGPPPLERVILYVDDLDRCPPRTVVDVLAAVNLLLSFPLFVVVVAVDPVWLERSIVQHRRELLGDGEHDSGHGPLDYLDKIFQVPFALRPMGATGDALIDALLPPPVPEADGRAGPRGGAADDRPGPDLPPPVPAAGDERHQPDPLPTRPVAPPPLDLQPGRLYLRETEREFAKRLRPLLRTPRNVKKLVNLYRLVRIGVPDAALTEFIGTDGAGPYQAVLVLLALTVESPAAARRLFTALEETPAEPDGTGGGLRDLLARIVATPAGCDGPARELTRLARLLDAIAADRELRDDLATYRTWAGTVARFSFETYELVHETKGG